MRTRTWFPDAALDWLVPPQVRVLTIAGSRMLPALLAARGNDVVWSHTDAGAIHNSPATTVIASADQLPFESAKFDVVAAHQTLAELSPELALAEIARVLRPGGRFAASTLARDDSVPWVRRFSALLRRFDPMAMSGRYGTEAIDRVRCSRYFPEIEHRQFRIWQPITREGLLDLVRAQPLAARLDDSALGRLLDDVSALYDDSARPAEDLMLPFQLLCWRATPAHDAFPAPLPRAEPGLRIQL